MGYVLSLFAFLFLICAIAAQIISFMTSNMYENVIIPNDHDGIFRRCSILFGCNWWDFTKFDRDPSKQF
jgi:hypothetical protein